MPKESKEPKEPKWRNSAAQIYLYDGLKDGSIPLTDVPPREIYLTYCQPRPEFKNIGYDKFAGRLRTLREKVKAKDSRAKEDDDALKHDRRIYPRPVQDGFGLPHWPDSQAKARLSDDIDANKLESMSKEALWCSRPEYFENYPFETFVKHIHQAVRSRKFKTYCQETRAKKRTTDN